MGCGGGAEGGGGGEGGAGEGGGGAILGCLKKYFEKEFEDSYNPKLLLLPNIVLFSAIFAYFTSLLQVNEVYIF